MGWMRTVGHRAPSKRSYQRDDPSALSVHPNLPFILFAHLELARISREHACVLLKNG